MIWRAFKFLFSAGLLALAGFFVYLLFVSGFQAMPMAIASVLLFFAAWPWVNHERPNRSLSLVGIVFSLMFAVVAVNIATGGTQFPKLCNGRRVLFCELENALYSLGGNLLAATPFAALAVFFFAISFISIVRFQRQRYW